MHLNRHAGLLPFCALLFMAGALSAGEEVKCPCTKDVWVSTEDEHGNTSGGKVARIKMKVIQEFGLMDFDVAALKGKKIAKATLYIAPDGGAQFGGGRGTDLRWFTVTTVSSAWEEGQGGQYALDTAGHGPTINEASYKTRPWSYPGSKIYDVSMGNGNTLRCDVDAHNPQNGYFAIPLDKRLVEALVAKASCGFVVQDGSTGVDRNQYVCSREGGKPPYLSVELAGDDAVAPKAPADLSVKPAPNEATPKDGALQFTLTVPEKAFTYEIKIDGNALPRWQVPFALKPGAKQNFAVEYLPADKDVKVEFSVVDASGNASAPQAVAAKTSGKLSAPTLPESDFKPAGGAAPTAGKLKVWAYPEICKLDPLTGKIMQEEGVEQAEQKNAMWDGATSTIRVPAARGEIAGFQLALQSTGGAPGAVKLELAGLDGIQVKYWRTWYVPVGKDWSGDYALPLKDPSFTLPFADDRIKGQTAWPFAIDLIVPETAKPGEQDGTLTVTTDGGAVKLKVKLVIYNAVIPKEISFNPEINAYGGPGDAGTDFFFDAFRIAHYHRSTINRVPYSQGGNSHPDWIPQAGGDGHVTSWANFDKNLGPLLDGTAFKDNPRAGVPVPDLYLPLHENWPLNMRQHYHSDGPVDGANWKAMHDILAKGPDEAFDKEYKDAFVNCVSDFAKHADEKGWTKTELQVFFNNKFSFGKEKMTGTAWLMDEPYEALDWVALDFYGKLTKLGAKDAKKAIIHYRGDISRPYWQGSALDGAIDVMYSNSEVFGMLPLLKGHKLRAGIKMMNYGGCNGPADPFHSTTMWCLKSYISECDGVLPWQGLGSAEDLQNGENPNNGNALIVDGRKFGVNAVASYRVHAFRVGAQLCELLNLVIKKNGWGRGQAGLLVQQYVTLGSEFKQGFADDAAALKFKNARGDSFVQLKEGLLKLLAK